MWQKISSEEIFHHPRLSVTEDTVKLPDGKITKYLMYSEGSDFVTVIPRTVDGKIILVRDYSYPFETYLLQCVEGVCEKGETPLEAAERELMEEAGYSVDSLSILAILPKHHRRDKAQQIVVFADNVNPSTKIGTEDEEQGISSVEMTPAEIVKSIADGELIQRNTLAALAVVFAVLGQDLGNGAVVGKK